MCSGSECEAYRDKYRTFQGAYSPEMIEDLMKKAGENVLNNKEKLLREIAGIVQQKWPTSAWKSSNAYVVFSNYLNCYSGNWNILKYALTM